MAYKITDECISCGACAAVCPAECIVEGDDPVADKKVLVTYI